MASDGRNTQELTRRLVARASTGSEGPDASALAVLAACERTHRELTRRLGQTGSNALLTRALAQARTGHPVLKAIRIGSNAKSSLDGVAEALKVHGVSQVAAGLETTLEKLLDLLSRLIGDDMVVRLVGQSTDNENAENEDVK
jgi:hypothetical protein